ncbi:MAG: GyrI-like domain-containing protein, partial [Saprospiraceae bacterium]
MSLKENATHLLWKTFMPLRKEIKNVLDSNLYSIQIYGSQYFQNFNPNNQFEKWAAVEVSDLNSIPT